MCGLSNRWAAKRQHVQAWGTRKRDARQYQCSADPASCPSGSLSRCCTPSVAVDVGQRGSVLPLCLLPDALALLTLILQYSPSSPFSSAYLPLPASGWAGCGCFLWRAAPHAAHGWVGGWMGVVMER